MWRYFKVTKFSKTKYLAFQTKIIKTYIKKNLSLKIKSKLLSNFFLFKYRHVFIKKRTRKIYKKYLLLLKKMRYSNFFLITYSNFLLKKKNFFRFLIYLKKRNTWRKYKKCYKFLYFIYKNLTLYPSKVYNLKLTWSLRRLLFIIIMQFRQKTNVLMSKSIFINKNFQFNIIFPLVKLAIWLKKNFNRSLNKPKFNVRNAFKKKNQFQKIWTYKFLPWFFFKNMHITKNRRSCFKFLSSSLSQRINKQKKNLTIFTSKKKGKFLNLKLKNT
jgi:hypothetical protein